MAGNDTKLRVVQTTARIPEPLYREARAAAEQMDDSFNDLLVSALRIYLRRVRKMKIDASFAGMKTDDAHRLDAERIEGEFRNSDWEVELES